MSKARSPREVCSTTIGTRGLTSRTLLAARRPKFAGFLAPALGLEDLLAGLGFRLLLFFLLERDRHGGLGHDLDRLARPDVVFDHRDAAVLAQSRQQLLGAG